MNIEIAKRRTRWRRVFWVSVLLQCGILLGIYGTFRGKEISYEGLEMAREEKGGEMIQDGISIALWSTQAGIVSFLIGSILQVLSKKKLKELRE